MASLLLFCWIRRNNPKRKEALEQSKGAMVGVNERLKKRGYFVPCQSGERRIYFVFLLLTFVDCKAGLLFYILIQSLFHPYFFTSLYIFSMYIKKVRVTIFSYQPSSINQKIKRRASHSITDRKPSNTTTKILLIKSTVSKESHNSMAKITIMHMIFKNKLIIYITPPILSPTQFEYPSFGELEIYQWGKCTAAADMSGFRIIFVPSKCSLFIQQTTVDMLCLMMDGAYRFFVPQHNGSSDNNHYFRFYKGMDSHIVSP